MTTATDITVPLLDLKAQYATIRDEVEPVIKDVVESQWFIGGPEVAGLETECAAYCNVPHAVGCASGSDAIASNFQVMPVRLSSPLVSLCGILSQNYNCQKIGLYLRAPSHWSYIFVQK